MPPLSRILESNRRRLFVGREREVAQAERLLSLDSSERLLFVVGPGGLGKSTLLAEIELRVRSEGGPVIRLDARYFQAAPDRFAEAVRHGLSNLAINSKQAAPLLMVDTFEQFAPVETWFHSTFLPELDSSIRLVIAGRQPPSPRWRTDLGWVELMQIVELANFTQAETESYLFRRNIEKVTWEKLWQLSQGNPLILALGADVCERLGAGALENRTGQDQLQQLMLDFVGDTLTRDQAQALQAAAVTQALTQPLLEAMLPGKDVEGLYDWLSSLSFVIAADRGLVPHDLVREAVSTDLRRRDPEGHEEMIQRAEGYYAARLVPEAPVPAEETIAAISYLSRFGSAPSVLVDLLEASPIYADAATGADVKEASALVARHQGAIQQRLFDCWTEHRPEQLIVVRDGGQRMVGFYMFVDFGSNAETEPFRDSVIDACRRVLGKGGGARPKKASLCRFWLDREAHLAPSAVQGFVLHRVIARAAAEGLDVGGVLQADDEITRTIANVAGHQVVPLDFEMADGTVPLVTLHDWSVEPISAWMVRTNRRIRGLSGAEVPPVLEPEAFKLAVRQALKHFTRPDRLRKNPLLSMCAGGKGEAEFVDALRAAIIEASASLRDTPRTARYDDILQHSYIRPAVSQLAAAETLNMAPSTYYRHLTTAVDLLTGALRQRLANGKGGG